MAVERASLQVDGNGDGRAWYGGADHGKVANVAMKTNYFDEVRRKAQVGDGGRALWLQQLWYSQLAAYN